MSYLLCLNKCFPSPLMAKKRKGLLARVNSITTTNVSLPVNLYRGLSGARSMYPYIARTLPKAKLTKRMPYAGALPPGNLAAAVKSVT